MGCKRGSGGCYSLCLENQELIFIFQIAIYHKMKKDKIPKTVKELREIRKRHGLREYPVFKKRFEKETLKE